MKFTCAFDRLAFSTRLFGRMITFLPHRIDRIANFYGLMVSSTSEDCYFFEQQGLKPRQALRIANMPVKQALFKL